MSRWAGGWQRRTTRKYLIARDGNRCAHCVKSGEIAPLTIDHIVPVSRGGRNAVSNLRLLCVDCHDDVTARWIRGFGFVSPRDMRIIAAERARAGMTPEEKLRRCGDVKAKE